MKIRLKEPCGIVYEVEAELCGVAPSGELCFTAHVDMDSPTLMEAEVDVDELPNNAGVTIYPDQS